MFDVSLSWLNGAGQVLVYALVISAGLWVMSKIKSGGESSTDKERGR
jgi:hypothetical protein